MNKNKLCENCGTNRWKTKVKLDRDIMESKYECRNCGYIRTQTQLEKYKDR